MTGKSLLEISRVGPLAVVRLSRPERRNAVNRSMKEALLEAFIGFRAEGGPSAVVLTGTGEDAFCAGADVDEMDEATSREREESVQLGCRVTDAIEKVGIPVIAAIRGWTLGGGCELALASTLIFASDNLRIGLPEIKMGLIPGWGGMQRLPRRVGRGRAMMMILSGEPVTAEEALSIGLVDRLYPDKELEAETLAFAQTLCEVPRAAAAACRMVGHSMETDGFVRCSESKEGREGVRAFREGRTPKFTGIQTDG